MTHSQMIRSLNKFLLFVLLLPVWLAWQTPALASDKAVVHAVLFYSPSCGHCHYVITETLPPLLEKYGEQLMIIGVDASDANGQALFMAVIDYFNLESSGVPFLVVGDTYLIGSADIPEKFPGLIEQYLAQGGVGWPAIPGLAEAMNSIQEAQASNPTAQAVPVEEAATPVPVTPTPASIVLPSETTLTPWERLGRDPAGNSLALVVLVAMLLALIAGVFFLRGTREPFLGQSLGWLIPVLCLLGLGVAGYLAYVETAQVEAVCGPVGDCNTVQQSEYARLFGVLPIGVMGLMGYVMILLAWGFGRSTNQRLAAYASLALLGLTSFGLLFSIYLTFLEPFVIGATCAWCVTSAILMTALFWLSLPPARTALSRLKNGENNALD